MLKNTYALLYLNYEKTGTLHKDLEPYKPTDIGQGFGYKTDKDWEQIKPDEVCYIPECSYRDDNGNKVDVAAPSGVYTKQDFLNLVKEPSTAKTLFNDVDWQPPETLMRESDWLNGYAGCRYEIVRSEVNKAVFKIYDNLQSEYVMDSIGNDVEYDSYEEAFDECADMNLSEI